ncbi:GldM family protein [Mangrovimonas sp. TPBH4]|uniref:GldM family protein n=1 Tax=Mangrovimonas sp. TPBH4 TaxID=1645914 RepID=UPI0006B4D3DB|nr:GldM family protein [Mangrovimonas sp. TPBH4]
MLNKIILLISLLFLCSCKSKLIVDPEIIYNRIENYVSINSPKSESIVVLDNNKIITPNEDNKYLIHYNNKKTIKIITYNKNSKVDSINYSFKTKNLKCYAQYKINGINSNNLISKNQLKNAVISAYHEDFIYNSLFEITGFKVKIPGYSTIIVKGNKITDEIYNIIQNEQKGENIMMQIFDVEGGLKKIKWEPTLCHPPELIIEIKNNR